MDEIVDQIVQQDPRRLASHYTWKKRTVEIVSIVIFTSLIGLMLWRAWGNVAWEHAGWLVLAFFAALPVADFISGLVHWLADTWGTVEYPIVGPTLIKNFREHHVDPKAITRHDVVETNGDNCMILLPAQVAALFIPLQGAHPAWIFLYGFVGSFCFWIMMTNQFHKWAHLGEDEVPWWINILQKTYLILPRPSHDVHHTAPFESHYCITNGWCNVPLAKIRFFRRMEWLIWKTIGWIPRENDIGTKAAVKLAIKQGILPPDFVPTRDIKGTRQQAAERAAAQDVAPTPDVTA